MADTTLTLSTLTNQAEVEFVEDPSKPGWDDFLASAPLKDAVGLDVRRDHLRRYVTWTADDFSEFTDALRAQRVVDERYWR